MKDLEVFLEIVAKSTASDADFFPITIIVGGLLISGMLIGEEAYFRKLGVGFNAAEINPESHFSELLGTWLDSAHADAHAEPFTTEFLHLSDAIPLLSIPVGGADGMLLRIRLDQVQGYSLGVQLRYGKDSPQGR